MTDGCSNSEPFALQVTDRSMEPEFPQGCVIVVEPVGVIEHGSFVVARHEDDFIFRKLVIDQEDWQLEALEPGHDTLAINGIGDIRGRVIQRSGAHRKDRKSYL